MKQRKLLMIVNPAAGKTKSRGPPFDAVSLFSDAGYLVSAYKTAASGDAAACAANRKQIMLHPESSVDCRFGTVHKTRQS